MFEQNENRVVGVFTDLHAANSAVVDLQNAGFQNAQIRLIENQMVQEPEDTSLTSTRAEPYADRRGFFSRLFGIDEPYGEHEAREYEADPYFNDVYTRGQHLVVVTAGERYANAIEILRRAGGDVDEQVRETFNTRLDQIRTMRLNEEQLQTRKETIDAGEVRVHKEIVTETKTIEVPVTREEVVIERRPLSGAEAAVGSDDEILAGSINEGDEIRIQLSEEEVHVEKRTVPREEVRIGKERIKEVRQVTEELKHEEARIEKSGTTRVHDRKRDEEERRTS